MGYLTDSINTLPNKSSYDLGSENPTSITFIAYISEGKEESEYLDIFKDKNKHLVIYDVLKYYATDKMVASHSHPKKRYEALVEFIDAKNTGFSPKLDKAFLITDRDNQSLKEKQYDEIARKCAERNIEWIVSNPSFQLWLLLHFTNDIVSLNLEAEDKCKKRINVIEEALKGYCKGYNHGKIQSGQFSTRIDDALRNAERLCSSVEDLKNNIGTRFPILVRDIKL